MRATLQYSAYMRRADPSFSVASLVTFAQTLLLLILPSSVALAQTCVPSPPGLVSWWAAEGDALDSADSNHGTLVNGATFAPGVVGQAFSFDGVDDAVIVPDAPNLNPTTQISIEAWVLPTANSGASDVVAMIVNKENFATLGAQYEIARRNDVACPSGTGIPTGNFAFSLGGVFGLPNECTGWVDGYASLPLNTWSHVALTFDSATVRAYVNGVLTRAIDVSGTLPVTDGFLRIGARDTPPGGSPFAFWAGSIDEVSLYDRALSAAEIASIFNAGSAGKCFPVDDLSVGGMVTGMSPSKVVCENKTTRRRVTIQMRGANSWDCEAAGLVVNAGDTIIQTVTGSVD